MCTILKGFIIDIRVAKKKIYQINKENTQLPTTNPLPIMEVFMRLNDDCDKDYCFQIEKNEKMNDKLVKFFDPKTGGVARYMNFKPSIFHNKKPSKFYKSVHPGYLTMNGTLLFDYHCDDPEYLVELDLSGKPISQQMWPHQLIVPQWDYNPVSIVLFTVIMCVWLYTDLPDFISPTPGICMTNNLSRIVRMYAVYAGRRGLVEKLNEELRVNTFKPLAQIGFFILHILKVIFVVFFFKVGMANPISFNPFVYYRTIHKKTTKQMDFLKSHLSDLGYIGIRRLSFDDYYSDFYNAMIKKAGGAVNAYKLGYFEFLRNPGLKLTKGEGFQTPLVYRFDEKHQTFDLLNTEKKFYLSEQYYLEVEKVLKASMEEIESLTRGENVIVKVDQKTKQTTYEKEEVKDLETFKKFKLVQLLKTFRKFGFYDLPEKDSERLASIYKILKENEAPTATSTSNAPSPIEIAAKKEN